MSKLIYADNAATTTIDKEVVNSMIPWLTYEYANASQSYSLARNSKKALSEARITIAECINSEPDEVFFTSCGSESDNWVIKGAVNSDSERNQIITSAFEHHAIINSCKSIESQNYPIVYLKPNCDGYISEIKLTASISKKTRLVSIMYANNEIGTIQPVKELSIIAHKQGALFHTDAVQAVGHIPIDVKKLGVDFLSASAHKFNGPKGVGFLYVKKGTTIKPLINGGSQEKNMRAGTENIASIVGMAEALKINSNNLDQNSKKLQLLEQELMCKLTSTGIVFKKNGGDIKLPGLISLSFPGKEGETILHRMDLMGICISTGAACDSVDTKVSHVLKAIDLDEKYSKGTIRISLGKNNSHEDVDIIVQALSKILK